MPDDDVEAFLLVLRIAHMRFNELPKKGALTLESLVDLAVICDKYDRAHIVRPFPDHNNWAQPWFANLHSNKHTELLFVTWTLGYSSEYEDMAKWAVQHTAVTASRVSVLYGELFPKHMPPGLIGELAYNETALHASVLLTLVTHRKDIGTTV